MRRVTHSPESFKHKGEDIQLSNKSSLAFGKDEFHLYKDVFDTDGVYLELEGEGLDFEVFPGVIRVRIPGHVWELIRQRKAVSLEFADKNDEEIRAMVEETIDQRIADYEKAEDIKLEGEPGLMNMKPGTKAFVNLMGGGVFGKASDSREQQVERGFQEYLCRRNQQRDIKEKIEALEKKNEKVPGVFMAPTKTGVPIITHDASRGGEDVESALAKEEAKEGEGSGSE